MSPCRGLAAGVSHAGTSAAAGRRVVFLLPFLLTIISPQNDDWQTTTPAETNKRWEQRAARCQGSMLWNARQCVPRLHPLKICAEVTPLNNARWSPARHDGVWWRHHGPQPSSDTCDRGGNWRRTWPRIQSPTTHSIVPSATKLSSSQGFNTPRVNAKLNKAYKALCWTDAAMQGPKQCVVAAQVTSYLVVESSCRCGSELEPDRVTATHRHLNMKTRQTRIELRGVRVTRGQHWALSVAQPSCPPFSKTSNTNCKTNSSNVKQLFCEPFNEMIVVLCLEETSIRR